MNQDESVGQLRAELVTHLQEARISGLPLEWMIGESPTSPAVEIPTGSVATAVEEKVTEMALLDLPTSSTVTEAAGVPNTAGIFSDVELPQLAEIASQCRKCRLCETRNKVVFGVGNTNRPLIAFVGEGPGADEDRVGEPFVGRAGQLLTGAITKGLGLRREDVYIGNVVKCRPPENRAPLPDEVEACTPYLYRQLEIIQPRVIVTLGQPAQLALSGVKLGITKLRGQWQSWRGIRLMPTFHPAYLLRNPPAKKPFWEDLQTVMAEVGLERPKKGESF